MITPAIMGRLRKYALRGDDQSITEMVGDCGLSELVLRFDQAVQLAAKAMTGGNISAKDNQVLSELCKMIGHEP